MITSAFVQPKKARLDLNCLVIPPLIDHNVLLALLKNRDLRADFTSFTLTAVEKLLVQSY